MCQECHEELMELREAIGRMEGKIDEANRHIAKIESRLFFGNGQESIVTRVKVLEEGRKEERRKDRKMWGIVMAAIGLASSILGGVAVVYFTSGI